MLLPKISKKSFKDSRVNMYFRWEQSSDLIKNDNSYTFYYTVFKLEEKTLWL